MAANSNKVKRWKVGAVKAAASGCSRVRASAGILFRGASLAGDLGLLTHHPGYQPGGPLVYPRAPHDEAPTVQKSSEEGEQGGHPVGILDGVSAAPDRP